MIAIFTVLEVMSYQVFFHVLDSSFNRSNFPEAMRSVLKLVQFALFLIFTYANIMASFFKTNIFQ